MPLEVPGKRKNDYIPCRHFIKQEELQESGAAELKDFVMEAVARLHG